MPDVVTLTLNPAVDLAASVERIVPTHKMRCSSAMRDPGGGGINVARAVHRFGVETLAVFPAGGVTGALLSDLLAAEMVPHTTVPIGGVTREDVNILEMASGQEYRFVMEGPPLAPQEADACVAALRKVGRCKFLVASGSLPPGVAPDFLRSLVPVARDLSAKLVVDTSGPALNGALGEGLFMIKPSVREMESVVGGSLRSIPEMVGACRQLIARRAVEIVALSLGGRGAVLVTATEAWHAPAPNVHVVGTVGSGDSFLAGVLLALLAGKPMGEACGQGVAAGAAAISSTGTKLCQPNLVDRYCSQIRPINLS